MSPSESSCPVVGKCPHEPVEVIPNSFFLIQPFDKHQKDREKAIERALEKYDSYLKHSHKKHSLKKSDSMIYDSGVFCDICRKIKSSRYCIADITGESYNIVDENGEQKSKVFIRPNVALELGMSYALGKPVFILSRKLSGKREIPTDIRHSADV